MGVEPKNIMLLNMPQSMSSVQYNNCSVIHIICYISVIHRATFIYYFKFNRRYLLYISIKVSGKCDITLYG